MYIVIDEFNDLEDNRHKYVANDIYPYQKKDVNPERIMELSSTKNKLKKVLIKEISLNEMSIEQLVSYAKREEIDLTEVIIKELEKNTNDNNDSLKELEELRKTAKKMKLDFSEDTEIKELKEMIKLKEKNK